MFFFDMEYPIPVGTLYCSRVWVCPDVRGQGIARALMLAAESFAADSGATHLFAACVPHNGAMRRLFGELGWSYQQGVDYFRAGPAMLFRIRPNGQKTQRAWSLPAAARLLSRRASAGGRLESAHTSKGGQTEVAE